MQNMFLKEDHPLLLNLSFGISLGLLPVTVSLKTAGCGIKSSGLPIEEAGDTEHSSKSCTFSRADLSFLFQYRLALSFCFLHLASGLCLF